MAEITLIYRQIQQQLKADWRLVQFAVRKGVPAAEGV